MKFHPIELIYKTLTSIVTPYMVEPECTGKMFML